MFVSLIVNTNIVYLFRHKAGCYLLFGLLISYIEQMLVLSIPAETGLYVPIDNGTRLILHGLRYRLELHRHSLP